MCARVILYGHLCFFLSRFRLFKVRSLRSRGGEIPASPLRVILYMGSPQIFNFWGERKQQSPNDASVIHCDLLAERESTAKTFLRFSIAASAQQMHLLLPILLLCSAIFRRVFLALRSPRSLREPLLQLRCHHLALATQLALAQKSTFLKIFLLIYLSYTLPSSAERRAGDDRANNGTTPRPPKVLFVNICYRHGLFSARGFPREVPSVLLPRCCYARQGPLNGRQLSLR